MFVAIFMIGFFDTGTDSLNIRVKLKEKLKKKEKRKELKREGHNIPNRAPSLYAVYNI